MNYYIDAFVFGILPIVIASVFAMVVYRIRPIRKAMTRWIEH